MPGKVVLTLLWSSTKDTTKYYDKAYLGGILSLEL